MQPRFVSTHAISERGLFEIAVPSLDSLPGAFEMPSAHFVAMLALDARSVGSAAIEKFTRDLLKSGCAYFCAWGPDCERVHDIFDSQCDDATPLILTTWHADESLDEVIWSFANSTWPADEYWDSCRSGLAVSVGSVEWQHQIHKRLADLRGLSDDVLREV